jgi:hypothetical protein
VTTAGISSEINPGEIVMLEDGLYYYWPKGCDDCFSPQNLRNLADHFDELNEKWSKDVDNYFDITPKVG